MENVDVVAKENIPFVVYYAQFAAGKALMENW